MKICIVGGGNIGTAMAIDFSRRGILTNIFTSKPHLWNNEIVGIDQNGNKIYGKLNLVTSDLERAIDSTDVIFVTLPSHVQKIFVDQLLPFANPNLKIVCIPGFGGAEFIFQPIIKKGVDLFGFQRVPMISRLIQYGHEVSFSMKKSIEMTSINQNRVDLSNLFDIPIRWLPNYLCITLTPSNPILHTSRIYSMFRNFDAPLDSNVPFYANWNDDSSKILIELDNEVQSICRTFSEIDLSSVKSLKDHYESYSISEMTRKLSSIESLKNILSPMKKTPDGWIPDFSNRYFACDFPFGLDILLQFAEILDTPHAMMSEVMNWYRSISKNFYRPIDLSKYDLNSKFDLLKFYGGQK